jgi:acyl carrier protein
MEPKSKLINIFRNTFTELSDKPDSFIEKCTKSDIEAWDSGNHFMLISCIEDDFAISLDDEVIGTIESFSDAYIAIIEQI